MFPFQLADLPWAFVASLLKSKLLHCAVGHILLLADVLLAYGFLWLVKSFGILQGKRWQARLLHLSYSVNPLGRANMFSRWCQALFLHTMYVHGPEREDVFSKTCFCLGLFPLSDMTRVPADFMPLTNISFLLSPRFAAWRNIQSVWVTSRSERH